MEWGRLLIRHLLIALPLIITLLSSSARAAAVFDAAGGIHMVTVPGNTITWTHLIASGAGIFVACGWKGQARLVSTVTVNSVSMGTALWNFREATFDDHGSAAYWQSNPSSGLQTVTATFTGNVNEAACVSQTWTGLGSPRTARTTEWVDPGNSPAQVVVDNAVNNDTVLDGFWITNSAITVGGGHTSRKEIENADGDSDSFGTASAAATGSTTMSWTYTDASVWAGGGVAFPVAGAAAATPRLLLLGVGP